VSTTSVVGEVISFLAALGLGSALGQYLASSKDRRESRANVLSALAETEAARWAGGGPKASLSDFQASMRKFQTAALIARLPRDLAWQYGVLAQAARWLSDDSLDRSGDPEFGGGIEADFATATREAARAVSEVAWAWSPLHRWRWRRAKKGISALLAKLDPEETNVLDRSRAHGPL
jgi:hypothetical protein